MQKFVCMTCEKTKAMETPTVFSIEKPICMKINTATNVNSYGRFSVF